MSANDPKRTFAQSCSKPTNPLAREMSEAEALSHFLWGEVYGWDGVGLMDVYGFI
jgi:hypothetical protein